MTVAAAQVPSTQTDFPKLSYPTDTRFKTIGNGGHVANANGYDIRPYSDAALTTPLTYELVYYNASTGQFEMHVKIPSLSNGYVTYFGYGDTGLTTDGSSTATWSNGFIAVYHLADGTTLNVNSSTGSNNGTNNGATATAGKIDGGGSFASASSQYIDLGTGIAAVGVGTISAWANATTFPTLSAVTGFNNANANFLFIFVDNTGKITWSTSQGGGSGVGSHTLVTGTSYHLVWTATSGPLVTGYINAVSDWSAAAGFPSANAGWTASIGRDNVNSRFWNGMLDEVRYASVGRSSDWVTTEYNNQSAPGTFETLGTEVSNAPMLGIYTI